MRRSKLKKSDLYHEQLKNRRRILYGIAICVWIVLIYFFAVFVFDVCNFIRQLIAFKFLMIAFFVIIAFLFIFVVFLKGGIQNTQTFALTLSILSIFTFQYFTAEYPAKQYHLIEYSVLSFLFFSAFRIDYSAQISWIAALIGTALVGAGDEIIQIFVPGRFPTFIDFLLDVIAALYGLSFAAITQIEKRLSLLDRQKNRRKERRSRPPLSPK